MGKTDTLLELQDTDAVIDRLTKRLTEIKASLRETEQLVAARQALNHAEQLAVQRRAARKDLELADATVDDVRVHRPVARLPGELALDLTRPARRATFHAVTRRAPAPG